ncbi:hypothetical protein ACRN9T_16425 [Shewanella baltica]|uniref:hypothetical protein n=1 Tax=Shewanella baltica TaxID=62322 RepID=UPI003D7979F7
MTVQTATKFLFIPVSSAEGIGEYMRSMIIADEVKRLWSGAEIKFILSKQAPYAAQCPYPAVILEDTPTKQVEAVNQIMSDYLPDIVLFDASGRKSQLAHAHKLGAKVIFISQHKRKRSRGMKIGRALVTDCHWVVQPEFVIGPISWLDRLKLKLINKPAPLNIGPVFTLPDASTQSALLAQYQLTHNEFVLFNAGSGGHSINGELAADVFVKAAALSGGDTLLQATALHKPTLDVSVSKDQPSRITACEFKGLLLIADAELMSIVSNVCRLVSHVAFARLSVNLSKRVSINGLEIALLEISRLLRK